MHLRIKENWRKDHFPRIPYTSYLQNMAVTSREADLGLQFHVFNLQDYGFKI